MQNYPSSWLCKCGHVRADHGPSMDFALRDSICKVTKGMYKNDWVDNCFKFTPVDNLTYVEQLAKMKEVLK